ncbi:hypothetical protein FA255_30890, partial [Pseudomonas aeruginosa]|nr:hypothetical protein [Pseudomonas aeruginosa]
FIGKLGGWGRGILPNQKVFFRVSLEHLLDEAISAAQTIASFSLPVTMMIKESVNRAFETSLAEGLLFERRIFHSAFGLEDQKEGMSAFLSKRKAVFQHR